MAIFERERARFEELLRYGREAELPKGTTQTEIKTALVFSIIERGGRSWLELPRNSKRAEKFMREIAPKSGMLTGLQARQILRRWFLLSRFGRRLDTDDIFLWDYVTPDLERLADAHLTHEALRIHIEPDLVAFLQGSGLVRSPGALERLRSEFDRIKPYFDVARGMAMQTLSIRLTGHSIPRRVGETALHVLRPGDELVQLYLGKKTAAEIAASSKIFRSKLRLEQGLRIAMRVQASYLLYGILKAVVSDWDDVVKDAKVAPAWILSIPGWLKTTWSARDMSDERIRQEEDSTYDSEAIVQEQYDAWLEGLDDYVPSEDEKKAELQALREQERRGEFRIYKDLPR